MNTKNAFLVVGGDSLVGGGLLKALNKRGHIAYSSTRRRDTISERRIFIDFKNSDSVLIPQDVGYAYIIAAATNYERCEKDPFAHTINVVLIPRLISLLLEQGLFVTFISTNSVFGGLRPWPHEDDPHAPGIAYAVQKDAAEAVIRSVASEYKADHLMNIVRLTKILDRNTPPLPNWFDAWDRGRPVQAFSDLIFAPLSVQFAGEALATLGEKRISGNLHLSGSENVSYVDFAVALAERKGVNVDLIKPTTATEMGVHIAFKPQYSGLGMSRTTQLSGILPQTLNSVVQDLVTVS